MILKPQSDIENESLVQMRLEAQKEAKQRLINSMKYPELVSNRDNQHIFTEALLASCKKSDSIIDVLEALMNGGKGHTILSLLPELLNDNKTIFLTSFYKTVVDQFLASVSKRDFLERLVVKLGLINHQQLIIVSDKLDDNIQEIASMIRNSNILKGKVSFININDMNANQFADNVEFRDSKVLLFTSIQGTLERENIKSARKSKVKMFTKLRELGNRLNPLILIDELQAGFATAIDGRNTYDTYTYSKVTGYANITYGASFFPALEELNPKKIVGITGTPTIAQEGDTRFFEIYPNLITKEEVAPYSKKVASVIIDDVDSRVRAGIAAHNLLNNQLKTDGSRTATAVIIIPNEGKNNPRTDAEWMEFIRAEVRKNGGNDMDVAKFFGMDNDSEEIERLQIQAERGNFKYIVAKQKMAAGVNIKNITTFIMARESYNQEEIWNSIVQLWARGIRFWNFSNGITNWNEITTENEAKANTCTYFLPSAHQTAFNYYLSNFVETI